MTQLYDLSIKTQGVATEIRLNDVLVASTRGEPINTSMVSNVWMSATHNTITAKIENADQVSSDGEIIPPATRQSVQLKLTTLGQGSREVWSYAWPNQEQDEDEQPILIPEPLREVKVPLPNHPQFAWESSSAVRLKEIEQGLMTAVASIYRAFSDRDLTQLMELSKIRNLEMAQAMGLDPNTFSEKVKASFQDKVDNPGFALADQDVNDPSQFNFIPHWGGRVWEALSLDNERVLRTNIVDGERTSYDLFLAKVDNQWQWIR